MNVYVEIHRLMSLPVSLPNRGADGLAKRCHYGGTERQRLSSQSIKAHLRRATNFVVTGADGELIPDDIRALAARLGMDTSVRSALIGERVIRPELIKRGIPDDEAERWANAIMGLFRSGKEPTAKAPPKAPPPPLPAARTSDGRRVPPPPVPDPEPDEAEAEGGRQIIVLGWPEISALVSMAVAARNTGVSPPALRGLMEKRLPRDAPDALVDARAAMDAMRDHAGLDGCLHGRMATGCAVSRVDSAVHVAHALTVHPIQSAVDFFSAMDGLQEIEAGETGGAHINSRELTSGVYYLYAVVDTDQLATNIAGLTLAQRSDLVAWLVRAFSTVTPAAMLGSTAPYADPGDVLVTVTHRQPVSLMAAFARPCAPILEAASERLTEHAARVWEMGGVPRSAFRLSAFVPSSMRSGVERMADAVGAALA